MNLTFKGFLSSYCRELTGLDTDSLKRLCRAAAGSQPAAAEALMTFAAVQGKAGYLTSLAAGTWMEEGYAQVAGELSGFPGTVEEWLQLDETPSRYRKVWLAFRAKKDAAKNDRRVSLLMRDKAVKALESSELTVYRLYKDLHLNMGNVYAYLNNGDAMKVSKAAARAIMNCATGYESA